MEMFLSEDDYKKALERLEIIFDAKPGTSEGKELLELVKLIEEWEKNNYPID